MAMRASLRRRSRSTRSCSPSAIVPRPSRRRSIEPTTNVTGPPRARSRPVGRPENSMPRPVRRLTPAPDGEQRGQAQDEADAEGRGAAPERVREHRDGRTDRERGERSDGRARSATRAASGSSPSSSRTSVSRAGLGVCEDAVRDARRLLGGEALRPVGGRQLGLLLLGHRLASRPARARSGARTARVGSASRCTRRRPC